MNSIMKEYYPLFSMYQSLRKQLMEKLTDDDLSFSPAEKTVTLGVLCREIGEVEYAYIQSFKTFGMDFSYHNEEPGLTNSVPKLVAWFEALDQELKATVEVLSEDDIKNRLVDRGDNFKIPPKIQLDIYKEALLIFYGKSSIYMLLLGKDLPEHWQEWIG